MEKNFPAVGAIQMAWGCSGREVPNHQGSCPLFSKCAAQFGFTLITYRLVRFSPSLQPEWLFSDKHASHVLIWKPWMKMLARAGLPTEPSPAGRYPAQRQRGEAILGDVVKRVPAFGREQLTFSLSALPEEFRRSV